MEPPYDPATHYGLYMQKKRNRPLAGHDAAVFAIAAIHGSNLMSTSGRANQDIVTLSVYYLTRILVIHKEKGNPAVGDNMGGPGNGSQTSPRKANPVRSHVHVGSGKATLLGPGHGMLVPRDRAGDRAEGRGETVATGRSLPVPDSEVTTVNETVRVLDSW